MGFFDSDLSYPTVRSERMRHKRRRLVQGPNAYFLEAKCPECNAVTVTYSHSTSEVKCRGCSTVLCKPTGGKASFIKNCRLVRKPDH